MLLEVAGDGEDGGLGVERVEDRLDQQQVDAAVDQTAGRFGVGRDQLVEGDVAVAGIVDVGRDAKRSGWSGRARRRRSAAAADPGRSIASAASRARRAAARFIS